MRTADIPQIIGLSVHEKILLLEDIWDEIGSENLAVPQSHRDELDRRLERHRRNPGRLLSLAELQANVEKRK